MKPGAFKLTVKTSFNLCSPTVVDVRHVVVKRALVDGDLAVAGPDGDARHRRLAPPRGAAAPHLVPHHDARRARRRLRLGLALPGCQISYMMCDLQSSVVVEVM
jgi:hypothetical protein